MGVDVPQENGNHNLSSNAGPFFALEHLTWMLTILLLFCRRTMSHPYYLLSILQIHYLLSVLQQHYLLSILQHHYLLSILQHHYLVLDLQNQLQEWTEWANQKVMQAARRLSKDKAELKSLRQEKEEVERLKKEKQTLEENTMKKLSEMENALCKASGQVERANSVSLEA
ncbi:hypothetical protein GBA52_003883 [Prunus armeniaca]|nr:hypothetical protein GBA52_003883 [Prunus armeniaca]